MAGVLMKKKAIKSVPYVGEAAMVMDAAPTLAQEFRESARRAKQMRERARQSLRERGLVATIPTFAKDFARHQLETQKGQLRVARKVFANPESLEEMVPLSDHASPSEIKKFRRVLVFHLHPDRLVARLGRAPTKDEIKDATLQVSEANDPKATVGQLNRLREEAMMAMGVEHVEPTPPPSIPKGLADLIFANEYGEGTWMCSNYLGTFQHPISQVVAHVYESKFIPGRRWYVAEQPGADGVVRRTVTQRDKGHESWLAVSNPTPQVVGTHHFQVRMRERFAHRKDSHKRKLLATYLALKNHTARTGMMTGKYAVQFGGLPGGEGDYIIVHMTGGVVDGFISVLSHQKVIEPNTVVVQAKQLGIDLRPPPEVVPNPVSRRNPGDPELYQNVLAHLRAIHWIAWTAHWVASGPNYYGDHLLLQRLYSGDGGGPDIEAAIDTLGEKMVSHFGVDSVNPSVLGAKAQSLVQQAAEGTAGRFQALLALEQSLQHAIRAAWKANQSSAAMSLGVDDYLMGLANERETAIYLLQRRVGS